MKTVLTNIKLISMCTLLALSFGCSNDEDVNPPNDGVIEQTNGISANELDNYGGDLGILFNTRELVKKGYDPAKINVTTSATEGNYNQQLLVDPFTNMAQLKLVVDDLSDVAASELRNGIEVDIEILNDANVEILSNNFSVVSFEENGTQIDIDASELSPINDALTFTANMRHYLQLVDASGNYSNKIVRKPGSGSTDGVRLEEQASSFNPGTTSEQFYIYQFPNEDNTIAIYSAITNRYLRIGLTTRTFRQSGAYSFPSTSPSTLDNNLKFKVQQEANGLFTLRGLDDNKPLRRFANGSDINWHTNSSGTIQYFKIISLDVDWQLTELDAEYIPPILPAVDTSFGFNSTLRNCGSGSLEQQVGIERQVTTTYTSSVSETIGLSSRETTTAEVSVSATAEANFFGGSASVTGEVSAGIELSTEASSSSTVSSEESISETNTFFSNRTVTVLPRTASLVYDAYQTYSNVRVPYVKRLRLKGSHTQGSETLSGQDILTQLRLTNFSGVVTTVGSDFVEITLQGNMYLDNMVDTQTEVRDVAANCN